MLQSAGPHLLLLSFYYGVFLQELLMQKFSVFELWSNWY